MNAEENNSRRRKLPWKELVEKVPSHPSRVKMGLLLKVHSKMGMMERLVLERKDDHLILTYLTGKHDFLK